MTCPFLRYHPAIAVRHEMLREAVEQFADAGLDQLEILNAGPGTDGSLDFARTGLRPALREL